MFLMDHALDGCLFFDYNDMIQGGSAATQSIKYGTENRPLSHVYVAVSAGAGAITGAVAATGVGLAGQIAVNATVGAVSGLADTAIDADDNTEPMDYLVSALLGGTIGAIAGYLGGPGTASKHMQSAFKTALHNGNWRYFFTQTAKEAIRAGESATSGILRGTIPTISRFAIKYLRSEMLVE